MQIGVLNHPTRDPVVEIHRIAGLGFDFIDFTMEPPCTIPGAVDVGAVRAALSEAGLGVVGHTGWYLPLAHPHPGVREGAERDLADSIRLAAACGADRVTIHPQGKFTDLVPIAQIIEWHIDSLRRLCDVAKSAGATVMIENVPHAIFNDVVTIAPLLNALPDLRLLIDIGHTWLRGKQRLGELLDAFGDRLAHVHVSDNCGVKDDHFLLGVGAIEWPDAFRQLKDAGFDGRITMETYPDHSAYLSVSRDRLLEWWRG
jgi:sugar phosphate isomerase/epimerase